MGEMLAEQALGLCLETPHPCNRQAWWTVPVTPAPGRQRQQGARALLPASLAELQAQWQTVSKNKTGDNSCKKTVDTDLTLTFGPDVHNKENIPAHVYTHMHAHIPSDTFSVYYFSSRQSKMSLTLKVQRTCL